MMHQKQERAASHRQRLSSRIKNLFELCDQDRKGFVTRKELLRLTEEIALTAEEVNNAFYFLDTDKNGFLSLEEFVSGFDIFLGNEQVSSEKFKHNEISDTSQLFDIIDKDKKGFITKKDLQAVANDFQLTNEEIEEIFFQLHKKGLSVLTFRDFNNGLESLVPCATDSEVFAPGEEEVFTSETECDQSEAGEMSMEFSNYGQDELKAILTNKATELFQLCDKDNKNYLTQNDLLELTKELALTNEQVESAFHRLDTDENKFLTLDEFVEGFGLFLGVEDEQETDPEVLRRQAKAKELFDLCDKGAKGYVTKADLTTLTIELGLPTEQVNQIFDELDEDRNGFLTVYEFLQGFSYFLEDSSWEEPTESELSHSPMQTEYSSNTTTKRIRYEKEQSIDLLDADATQLLNNVDELITDSLTKEQLTELWKALRKSDSMVLTKFEQFLVNISGEIKKAKTETVHLENTLKRKSLSHDLEVQKLYEEMEQQIKNEKSKIRELESRREKLMKEELSMRLEDKEFEINRILMKQRQLEDKVNEYQHQEQNLKQENIKLSQQNMELEEKLNSSISSLEDTKSYISSLQASTAHEKRERVRVAMQASEGIAREHESLIRQLDMLREMNQKLRDDKDAIEASIKSRADRTTSLDDELQMAEGKRQLAKTGSIMSTYFTAGKTGRQNSMNSARNRKYLEKQGSIMSTYFEQHRGSQESLVYGDGTVGERRLDSFEEEDHPEWRRRVIKAVDENGEHMLGDEEESNNNMDASVQKVSDHDSSSVAENTHDHDFEKNVTTSTPLHRKPSPKKPRRMLPILHGGTGRLRSTSDENDTIEETFDVNQDNHDENMKSNNDMDENVNDDTMLYPETRETLPSTEDQMSATESEADRLLSSANDEDVRDEEPVLHEEIEESKQKLQDMLSELARPYKTIGEERKLPENSNKTSMPPQEEPPANPNRVYKIVFVGDSGVGKSSLIHRFCFDQFKANFSATIGVDFQVKIIKVYQEWVALQLWDTAGQERFRSITKQYFRKADGVVVMFDLCSEDSFKNVRSWMISIEESAEPECTVMLLGNKLDLANDGFRRISSELAGRLAEDSNSVYHEVSAKSGEGVHPAMVKMAKKLEEKEDSLMKLSVLDLKVSSKKKRGCCR